MKFERHIRIPFEDIGGGLTKMEEFLFENPNKVVAIAIEISKEGEGS